jgi:hypothetical protein
VLSLIPIGTASGMALLRSVLQLLLVASVPTAWMALRWTGYRRPEPGWIDRLGRCLGIFFCLAVTVQFVVFSLP